MLRESDLKGVFVPAITPFSDDERLDLGSYRSYIGKLIAHDIQGIVLNGTTGESPTVSWDETEELFRETKAAIAQGPNRSLPVVVGTGTNGTASTIGRTESAGKLGADAALVVVPYYSRPSQQGIVAHFRQVARVGVPVIAYEVPSRTGVRLAADTALEILELDGVIGIKDSSGKVAFASELTRRGSKPVLSGDDIHFHALLSQGATGGILASANLRTRDFLEVYRLFAQGDPMGSRHAFDALVPLIRNLFQESNPAPLKWLLSRQGVLASDALRSPMGPISKKLANELERLLPLPAK